MSIIWVVRGSDDPTVFDTKEAAEMYARMVFHYETEERRYARVYFREVWTLADLREQKCTQ